ncbi:MAG: LLM class flavin-dependent oxidoreductase [Actinobacteria bacterium]|nr:LLM class flavin-dependent oxidoreductase [Actinomycetota bacterium]
MRFGLALPHYDFSFPDGGPVTFDRVADAARTAERLGFDSVWISDHFFLSLARYGGGDRLHGSLEPMTTLAGLARVTDRVRLGTLVLSAAFRHPAILAKMATAVDLASGGRLDLGIGAGWYREEFDALGYGFEATGGRFEVLEESFRVLRALFSEGPADHDGPRFPLRGAFNRPLPAQRPGPPLWLGAKGGPRALRMAARLADGWNTVWRWTVDDYAGRVREARRICEEEGRDPDSLRLSIGLYTLVGEDDRDLVARYRALQRWAPGGSLDGQLLEDHARGTLTGTPERVRELLEAFAGLGVEETIVAPASVPFAWFDTSMLEIFSEAVIRPAAPG